MLVKSLLRVVDEGQGGFGDSLGRGLDAEFLSLQITVESIEEESVVGNGEPVKDLLFLLRPNAVVLEQELQEFRLDPER